MNQAWAFFVVITHNMIVLSRDTVPKRNIDTLDQLHTEVEILGGTTGSLKTSVQALETKIGSVNATIQSKVDGLHRQIDGLNDSMHTKLDGMNSAMHNIIAGLNATVQTELDDLRATTHARIDNLTLATLVAGTTLALAVDTKLDAINASTTRQFNARFDALSASISTSIASLNERSGAKIASLVSLIDMVLKSVKGVVTAMSTKNVRHHFGGG